MPMESLVVGTVLLLGGFLSKKPRWFGIGKGRSKTDTASSPFLVSKDFGTVLIILGCWLLCLAAFLVFFPLSSLTFSILIMIPMALGMTVLSFRGAKGQDGPTTSTVIGLAILNLLFMGILIFLLIRNW